MIILAQYYRFIDLFYRLMEKGKLTVVAYKRHGFVKTAKHIIKKLT